jgi:hypothetical protein
MNKLLFIIALLFFASEVILKNIKIIFEEQMLVKEESLIGVPEHLRAKFVKQVESIKSGVYICIFKTAKYILNLNIQIKRLRIKVL